MTEEEQYVHLVDLVTCPYCWNRFPPEDVYWVARHSHLSGDAVSGQSSKHTFLPSRFTIEGKAIDEMGSVCDDIACPICRGKLPKSILEMPPLCFSVLGGPGSGKSFFLGAMLQRMTKVFDDSFELDLQDSASEQNAQIVGYQKELFEYDDPNSWKNLDKTQTVGVKGLYRRIRLNDEDCQLAIPCLFAIQPRPKHPFYEDQGTSRMLCLYDCAGEYFEPNSGLSDTLVVDHLENSDMMLFVYDPFQESEFRRACAEITTDPQVLVGKYRRTRNQASVLSYAGELIRRGGNHPASWKYDRPLTVLVNKYDGWKGLAGSDAERLNDAICKLSNNMVGLDLDVLNEVSNSTRELLRKYSNGIVTAAESFAKEVYFLPASSTGVAPEIYRREESDDSTLKLDETYSLALDDTTDSTAGDDSFDTDLAFRAGDLNPMWTEIPLLLALARSGQRQKTRSLILTNEQELYEQHFKLSRKISGNW